MSISRFLLFLVLYGAIVIRAESLELQSEDEYLSVLLDPVNANRILLVGFYDGHIDRIQSSSAATGYRRRGAYSSSTWSRRITSQIEEQYGLFKLTEWPMTEVGIHCAVYLLPKGASMSEAISTLSRDERIDIVQRMHQFKTEGHQYNDPYYQLQSNMHHMEIEQAHASATGKKVKVAVIDTGVDLNHPDLAGQIEMNKNFVSAISSGFATDLHGTAVAGIIAARKDNETGIIGVAPDASVFALKACWPYREGSFEAACNSFTLALAVNTAIRSNVKILNMSLTGPDDPLLTTLLKKAKRKGIFVVAADPGEGDPYHRFPAKLEGVIPVQSSSNRNSSKKKKNKHIIKAPGDHILTTLPHGTYDFVSGSSLAAAQVSGVIALMLELDPDLSIEETHAILNSSIVIEKNKEFQAKLAGISAAKAVHSLCVQKGCRQ